MAKPFRVDMNNKENASLLRDDHAMTFESLMTFCAILLRENRDKIINFASVSISSQHKYYFLKVSRDNCFRICHNT